MKTIFFIMYWFMFVFRRKRLDQLMQEMTTTPGIGKKDPQWILSGLIESLEQGNKLTLEEKRIIALMLRQYAETSILVKKSIYKVSMSENMYREYINYSLKNHKE